MTVQKRPGEVATNSDRSLCSPLQHHHHRLIIRPVFISVYSNFVLLLFFLQVVFFFFIILIFIYFLYYLCLVMTFFLFSSLIRSLIIHVIELFKNNLCALSSYWFLFFLKKRSLYSFYMTKNKRT